MYPARPGLLIGFHGCDKSVRHKIVNDQSMLHNSTNDYDWLGNGMYFWENNRQLATAGFYEKSHIQLCIRNPNCIKGFFIPREEDPKWLVP